MWQVLSIGETVEEVSDSGFLAQAPTLRTQLLADDSMLQVSSLLRRPTIVSQSMLHCPVAFHYMSPRLHAAFFSDHQSQGW